MSDLFIHFRLIILKWPYKKDKFDCVQEEVKMVVKFTLASHLDLLP
ncbi:MULTISPECIES: hypothetical protein [Nitratiruptor]|nr:MULTISPECIES: hypothetical protein [Nitratiruptor]BCD62576.1 hypothetical protein NitYY0813_C1452 [Nitratiruptor sp. YY08-13]BCD66512.1 hypothetical protein NitYY0826_C1454 [Nitratiruptor sp. YY08-26]